MEHLPDSEKRVARYILDHPEEAPFLSIQKLAEAGKTSVASVTRLSQKAGCGSVKEMKIQLAGDINSGLAAVFEGITADDNDDSCVQKIFGGNIRSLEETLQIADVKGLRKAAALLAGARRSLFIGFGSSGYIACDAALRFTHLGMNAAGYREPIEMLLNGSILEKPDLLVAISHSGRTKATNTAAAAAKNNGAAVISVSNYPGSPLGDLSDIFLCTSFTENLTRAAAVSSRVSQICIIDALLVLTVRQLGKRDFIDRANRIVEDEFRR